MSSRLAIPLAAAAIISLAAAPARAIPVDVTDGSLRPILIDLESTPCDPALGLADHAAGRAGCLTMASDPGAVFGTTIPGTFEVVAGIATVTVAAADWELILFGNQGMSTGPGVPGIVPGTTSDAILTFDPLSGAPLGWVWTSTIIVPFFGATPLAGVLAASPNDVYFRSLFGNDVALNCNAAPGLIALPPNPLTECAPTYTPVGHIPYDALTGTITALGGVGTGLIREAWAPADWRLSEAVVPEPGTLLLLAAFGAGLVRVRTRQR